MSSGAGTRDINVIGDSWRLFGIVIRAVASKYHIDPLI